MREDLQNLATKEDMQAVLVSIDGLAGKVDTLASELGATNMHVSRIDRWVRNVSSIKLDD